MTLPELAAHIRAEAEYKLRENDGATITVLIPVAEVETVARALEFKDAVYDRLMDTLHYRATQNAMNSLLNEGRADSPEFRELWAQSETIKNRHGGLPPRWPEMPHLKPIETELRKL